MTVRVVRRPGTDPGPFFLGFPGIRGKRVREGLQTDYSHPGSIERSLHDANRPTDACQADEQPKLRRFTTEFVAKKRDAIYGCNHNVYAF
jgi:hypothetical protein